MSLSAIRAAQGETGKAGGTAKASADQSGGVKEANKATADTVDSDNKGRAENRAEDQKADFLAAKRDAAREIKYAELQNGVSGATQLATQALGLINRFLG